MCHNGCVAYGNWNTEGVGDGCNHRFEGRPRYVVAGTHCVAGGNAVGVVEICFAVEHRGCGKDSCRMVGNSLRTRIKSGCYREQRGSGIERAVGEGRGTFGYSGAGSVAVVVVGNGTHHGVVVTGHGTHTKTFHAAFGYSGSFNVAHIETAINRVGRVVGEAAYTAGVVGGSRNYTCIETADNTRFVRVACGSTISCYTTYILDTANTAVVYTTFECGMVRRTGVSVASGNTANIITSTSNLATVAASSNMRSHGGSGVVCAIAYTGHTTYIRGARYLAEVERFAHVTVVVVHTHKSTCAVCRRGNTSVVVARVDNRYIGGGGVVITISNNTTSTYGFARI